MADDPKENEFLAHARYRLDPLASGVRTTLAGTPLVERVAWHLGEALHMRQAGPTVRPEAADLSGRYGGPTVPTFPSDADRAPARFVPTAGINPVLTAADVTDFGRTDCVADPFLYVTETGDWHMFFEVYTHNRDPTAAIGHATSPDGYDWSYDRIVLETDEHLSYPYVFRADGEYYMVPDRWAKEFGPAGVTLYRAESFPHDWTAVAEPLRPETPLHDFSPFRWKGRWWALIGDGTDLYAYYSDDLEADDWTGHDDNPVVADRPRAARPGGRPIVFDDRVLAFYQDCERRYGESVRAYEIAELTPSTYVDEERAGSPVLAPPGGLGWNSGAMHTVDPWYDGEGWHCAVDGNLGLGYQLLGEHHWAIGIYRA